MSQTLKWTPPWSEGILQWQILNESVSRFCLQILSPPATCILRMRDQHCYEQKCPKELEIAGFEFYTNKKRLRYVSIVWTREGKGKRRKVWPATPGKCDCARMPFVLCLRRVCINNAELNSTTANSVYDFTYDGAPLRCVKSPGSLSAVDW